jgi:hypothetical protein
LQFFFFPAMSFREMPAANCPLPLFSDNQRHNKEGNKQNQKECKELLRAIMKRHTISRKRYNT